MRDTLEYIVILIPVTIQDAELVPDVMVKIYSVLLGRLRLFRVSLGLSLGMA